MMKREDCAKPALTVEKIEGPAVFIFSPLSKADQMSAERARQLLLVSALMNVASSLLLLLEALSPFMR